MPQNRESVVLHTPRECSRPQLNGFEALVLESGEVDPEGLTGRIGRAEKLGFQYEGESLIGIGALKHPDENYRKDVFEKAGVELVASDFPYELGWVYVIPVRRRRGIARDIITAALNACRGQRVFATSRADNPEMHACLDGFRFSRIGQPYASKLNDHRLVLFVR